MKVVLLHALPLDPSMWEPQREALAEHEVLAPRLYELGSTMDEWAAGVLAQAEGPFAAVGASMGGYCALAVLRRAPERMRGLVLAGSRADADSPERRAGRADTLRLIHERGVEGLWEDMRPKLFPPGVDDEVVARARTIAFAQRPEALSAAVGAIRDRTSARDLVSSLRSPLLVAVGDADPFVPVEDAREIAESAPHGSVHVFEGAGHLPSLERPGEFNRVLTEFLGSLA